MSVTINLTQMNEDAPPGYQATVVYLPSSATKDSDIYPTGITDQSSLAIENPLLAYIPAFTYSMPVQLLIHGFTLTLLAILLVHLLFTIRYHLPISKANWILQVTAVIVTIANVGANLGLLYNSLRTKGHQWPFMFDYVEVDIPPTDDSGVSLWNGLQLALWEALQGLVALACHATHIQFLTLLFPSVLEARLLLTLLGPLALISAFLTFTSLSSHPSVVDLGDAIRVICNSTLTLLYTGGLLIWSLYLNRQRAWRHRGDETALPFGIISIFLALTGTAVNFLEVKEDRLGWLPNVVWCILLWQSWTGFWWFVGSGMWEGEVEEMRKREKKARIIRRNKKSKRHQEQQANLNGTSTAGKSTTVSTSSRLASFLLRRRKDTRNGEAGVEENEDQAVVEMDTLSSVASTVASAAVSVHGTTSSSSNTSTPPDTFITRILSQLRQAHNLAAFQKASRSSSKGGRWDGLRGLVVGYLRGVDGQQEGRDVQTNRRREFASEGREVEWEDVEEEEVQRISEGERDRDGLERRQRAWRERARQWRRVDVQKF